MPDTQQLLHLHQVANQHGFEWKSPARNETVKPKLTQIFICAGV